MYEIIQTKGFNEIIIKDLEKLINRTKSIILDNMRRTLIPLSYVEKVEFPLYTDYSRHPSVFKLREKGITIAKLNPKFKNSVDRFREVDSLKILNKNLILLKDIYVLYKHKGFTIKDLIENDLAKTISKSTKREVLKALLNNRINELLSNRLVEKVGKEGKSIIYKISRIGANLIIKCYNIND